jgi:23S rRNA (cytidine1920-2'-O)/16S rRNA (cytidine1409-2'-O)-methyltransferase
MCDSCVTAVTVRAGALLPRRPVARRYGCRVTRRRVDTLLAERGLAPSRSAAAQSVRAGRVRLRDGRAIEKPSDLLPEEADLVVEADREFVSRGGIKLHNALESLPVRVAGRSCLDVGASTGGFTDCLLRHGAKEVIALDVGHGQLDWKLRTDPRVTPMERINARELQPNQLPYEPQLITVDVSFISLTKLLEPLTAAAAPEFDLLALVKPQFELGPERVGKGGVVRDEEARREALRDVAAAIQARDLVVRGFASSGLPGPKGNLETFIWAASSGRAVEDLEQALERADA